MPALTISACRASPLDAAVPDADAVVLVTAHPGIDHLQVARDATLFIDLRGVTRGITGENLVRL